MFTSHESKSNFVVIKHSREGCVLRKAQIKHLESGRIIRNIKDEISILRNISLGSFQEFRDIGQNLFFCYKSFISCGKSESKRLIS